MGRLILLILIVAGAFFLYQNQDELLANAKELFLKEKTIMKVNSASQQKQQMIEEAERNALEF